MPENYHYELRIVGDGPQRKQWRNICRRLGIEQHCKWMGSLSYDQAMKQYEWADIFVFTSLRDSMGTVVLEALSCGIPVICLDHSGSHDVVTNDCGVKIPVTTADEVILRLRDVIISISHDRTKLEALRRKAIERAREYLWSRNGEQMAEIYDQVLKSKNIRNAELVENRSDACRSF
jgi:glycosyltransferase involved in cell wall biosynthesis